MKPGVKIFPSSKGHFTHLKYISQTEISEECGQTERGGYRGAWALYTDWTSVYVLLNMSYKLTVYK